MLLGCTDHAERRGIFLLAPTWTRQPPHQENDLTGITRDQATCLGLIPVDLESGHPGLCEGSVITIHSRVDRYECKKGSQLDTSSNRVVLSQLNYLE